MTPKPLSLDALRHPCAAEDVPYASTADAEPRHTIGQERALEALELAADLRAPGHHVFATGPPGTSTTRRP